MLLNFVKLQFEQMSFSGFGFWCLVIANLMPVRGEEPGQQLLGLNITIIVLITHQFLHCQKARQVYTDSYYCLYINMCACM